MAGLDAYNEYIVSSHESKASAIAAARKLNADRRGSKPYRVRKHPHRQGIIASNRDWVVTRER